MAFSHDYGDDLSVDDESDEEQAEHHHTGGGGEEEPHYGTEPLTAHKVCKVINVTLCLFIFLGIRTVMLFIICLVWVGNVFIVYFDLGKGYMKGEGTWKLFKFKNNISPFEELIYPIYKPNFKTLLIHDYIAKYVGLKQAVEYIRFLHLTLAFAYFFEFVGCTMLAIVGIKMAGRSLKLSRTLGIIWMVFGIIFLLVYFVGLVNFCFSLYFLTLLWGDVLLVLIIVILMGLRISWLSWLLKLGMTKLVKPNSVGTGVVRGTQRYTVGPTSVYGDEHSMTTTTTKPGSEYHNIFVGNNNPYGSRTTMMHNDHTTTTTTTDLSMTPTPYHSATNTTLAGRPSAPSTATGPSDLSRPSTVHYMDDHPHPFPPGSVPPPPHLPPHPPAEYGAPHPPFQQQHPSEYGPHPFQQQHPEQQHPPDFAGPRASGYQPGLTHPALNQSAPTLAMMGKKGRKSKKGHKHSKKKHNKRKSKHKSGRKKSKHQ